MRGRDAIFQRTIAEALVFKVKQVAQDLQDHSIGNQWQGFGACVRGVVIGGSEAVSTAFKERKSCGIEEVALTGQDFLASGGVG